jgi:hypothetical protein
MTVVKDSASGHVIASVTIPPLNDCGVALTLPRRMASSGQLKQQSLIGFLRPNSSKSSNPRTPKSRTKPGSARPPRRIPLRLSEPSDQSGTDSDVDAVHFEPKEVIISDDDDIQPSSPVRRRRTVTEVESHANLGTPTSSDSDDNIGTSERATSSVKNRRRVSRSPSTGHESPPKRRRLARVRPSSPEESDDNLLDEVNEAGNNSVDTCEVTTNSVRRYYPASLS